LRIVPLAHRWPLHSSPRRRDRGLLPRPTRRVCRDRVFRPVAPLALARVRRLDSGSGPVLPPPPHAATDRSDDPIVRRRGRPSCRVLEDRARAGASAFLRRRRSLIRAGESRASSSLWLEGHNPMLERLEALAEFRERPLQLL